MIFCLCKSKIIHTLAGGSALSEPSSTQNLCAAEELGPARVVRPGSSSERPNSSAHFRPHRALGSFGGSEDVRMALSPTEPDQMGSPLVWQRDDAASDYGGVDGGGQETGQDADLNNHELWKALPGAVAAAASVSPSPQPGTDGQQSAVNGSHNEPRSS